MAEDHYLRLRAAIVRDLKPDDVLDWINAYDHLNKLWEEQRYRRAGLALISVAQGGRILSRRYLCPPFHEEHALNFFSTNPKEKKEVIADLAKHGITTAVLQAKAAQIERDGLQLFDRMVAVRESGRRLLRKENERSARRQNGGPDDTAK